MKTLTTLALGAAIASGPALADLQFPSLSYRTGAYAAGGQQFADGYADYMTLINERDGGIGGEKIAVEECETAYNTEKGVECYEATKGLGSLVYQPLSTGITYQLIPKVTADDTTLLTSGYGRTSAKNGNVFSHVFNFPANYWDGASVAIKYMMDQSDGSLDGKKITLLYHNSAFGKEPIRTLEELSKKHGFDLSLLPVDHPGQEQKSQWLQIRRERPDFVLMYGWGVMNPTAIQEASNIRFPMEKLIGIWWAGSENDVIPAGQAAHGYKALTFNALGTDFPVFDDIQTYLVDKGMASNGGAEIGTVQYNRGIYAAMLVVEAARTAQEIHGVTDITPGQMRDGMENLDITAAKMEGLGMPEFGPEFKVTCENHGGDGFVAVSQWDANTQEWSLITDFIQSDQEVLQPLILEDSRAYAEENGIEPQC